jgi:TonB family protein
MVGNSFLKVAACISVGIHLLILGIASSLFQDPKTLRRPVRYVKVTILPAVAKEESKGKITLPVPLNVGDQNRKGPASHQEGPNEETGLPSESMARDVLFEEPKTPPQERQEGIVLKEPHSLVLAQGLPSEQNVNKAGNSVSSEETGSNEERQSISLPSLRSGESDGNGFSFDSSGGGLGVGKAPGNGSPGKGGSANSGKGTGVLGKFFFAHGGGSGDRPRYADNPKPIYPKEARDKGYEGEVVLRVEVLTNGQVGQIEMRKSSGYELLDHSALTAVKQWKFIPAKKGDVAIPLWVNIPIKFQLQ